MASSVTQNFCTILFSSRIFRFQKRLLASICPEPPKKPVVTLLDVSYEVGANLALLLKQNTLIRELRLCDACKDTFSLAEDLNHIDTNVKVLPFGSASLKDAIMNSNVVISTGGCQYKVAQTHRQLLEQNLDNVRTVALYLAEFNPKAIFCIAKPPVDALVPLVSEEYKKAETYDPRKIIGLTSYYSTIANNVIARHLNVDPVKVLCPLIGGASSNTLVPVMSQVRPRVEYSTKVYKNLENLIDKAEVKVLEKGSLWCYSKAVGIARFVNILLKALAGERKCVESAFVAQTGHIAEFLPYMTTIVQLGAEGVNSTHMPKINEYELIRLKNVLPHILDNIILGQTYLNGDFNLDSRLKPKRKADHVLKEVLKGKRIHAEKYGHTCP